MKKILLLLLFPLALNAQKITTILQPGVEGKDALVTNYSYETNFGDTKNFYAWGWTFGGIPSMHRSLIQFNLSSLPADAIIESAELTLFANNFTDNISIFGHNHLSNSNASILSRITSPWKEHEVNWYNQPSTASNGYITLPQSTYGNQNYTLNVTSQIADMVLNPESNYGFMLGLRYENYYSGLFFASGDDPDSTLHPKLKVTYTKIPDEIYIPDPELRKALKIEYPGCFTNDDLLIKNCAYSSAKTSLDISGKGIYSIEGIEYFKQLQKLNCSNNNLSALPKLPYILNSIIAQNNCFCPSIPEKPINISVAGWKVLPNKEACTVHLTVPESDVTVQANSPVLLKAGKSLFFDGIDDNIKVPQFPSSTGPFTVEYWANPSKLPARLNFPSLADLVNSWHHVTVTCSGDKGIIKIYVNGKLRVSIPVPSGTSVSMKSLIIGQLGSDKYKGYMNDLKIWNIVRTPEEIISSMFTFSDYSNSNLLGAWKMNEGTGNVVRDYSSHKQNGTIYGCTWQNEGGQLSYEWTPPTFLSSNSGPQVTLQSELIGLREYTVKASNSIGCTASQKINVIVTPDPKQKGTNFLNPIQIGTFGQFGSYSDTQNNNPQYGFGDDFAVKSDDIFYTFTLSVPSHVRISQCKSLIKYIRLYLFKSNVGKILDGGTAGLSSNPCHPIVDMDLLPGKYFIATETDDYIGGDITTEVFVSCPTETHTACQNDKPVNARYNDNVILGEKENTVALYPNPTTGKTTLSIPILTEPVEVRVSDLSGKIIQNLDAISPLTEINTSNLKEGMYLVSFTYQNKNVTRKLRVIK
ncbi:MAG: DNRLRE domain-containing protein [Opitutaceae bacterium]|nr:DNRLRE domain-containing protein [Cytophagales bacterium]